MIDYAAQELKITLSKHLRELYNFHRLIMEANLKYYKKERTCKAYVEKMKALRTEIAFREMLERREWMRHTANVSTINKSSSPIKEVERGN